MLSWKYFNNQQSCRKNTVVKLNCESQIANSKAACQPHSIPLHGCSVPTFKWGFMHELGDNPAHISLNNCIGKKHQILKNHTSCPPTQCMLFITGTLNSNISGQQVLSIWSFWWAYRKVCRHPWSNSFFLPVIRVKCFYIYE